MRPRDTIYRLAVGQRDIRRCRAIARGQGITDPCSFPTVLAERDGHVLGFLATARSNKAVIAGPLVIAPGAARPVILMMRLIEAYEVVLKKAGVVSFYFHVAATNPAWRRLVERMGHVGYHRDDSGTWYRRAVAETIPAPTRRGTNANSTEATRQAG